MPALAPVPYLADESLSGSLASKATRFLVLPLAATALLALSAHISLPSPFSPVPTTMQTFAVLLIAIVLGPGAAAISMLLYLAEGASGLPVFSPHGLGGPAQLLGPTGGYLLSYPFAALLVGISYKSLRRVMPASLSVISSALLGELVIFAFGVLWLMQTLHLPHTAAIHSGITPFIAAELVKVCLLAVLVAGLDRAKQTR